MPARLTREVLARAERHLRERRDRVVRNADIAVRWFADGNRCWYRRHDAAGSAEYVVVDASTGRMQPAFAEAALHGALRQAGLVASPSAATSIGRLELQGAEPLARFTCAGRHWSWNPLDGTLADLGEFDPTEIVSPDGRWAALRVGHDLCLRDRSDGTIIPLTQDGTARHRYAASPGDSGDAVASVRLGMPGPARVAWSPDSRRLLTQRIDERRVRTLHLRGSRVVGSASAEELYALSFAFPGDPHLPMADLMAFDVPSGRRVDLPLEPLHASYLGPLCAGMVTWSMAGRCVDVLSRDRYFRHWQLRRVDLETGRVQRVVEETGATQMTVAWFRERPVMRTLSNGDVLWFSESSGYGHLDYIPADGRGGHPVTRGDWLVKRILHVDEAAGRIYLLAAGREPGRNPYFGHVYRVGFDGAGLELLTPENADHVQNDTHRLLDRVEPSAQAFSPCGRYFADSQSRPDLPSRLVLRRADGTLVRELETADVTALNGAGFTMPETFEATAADGRTPLHGTLFFPSDFDARRRYAVVDSVYPGPQIRRVSPAFAPPESLSAQAIAELGFVVMTLDGRGTPGRSKAFWDESYGRMDNAGMLEDHVAVLRELAAARPWMDLGRAGIVGHSGGGYAAARAVLKYPEFFTAAVASAGDHDQEHYMAWWSDHYNGPSLANLRATSNAALASRLRGALLLVHGELDENVHLSQTLDLVRALISEDKEFDLLVVPGAGHSDLLTGYVLRRMWSFLIRELGPPDDR